MPRSRLATNLIAILAGWHRMLAEHHVPMKALRRRRVVGPWIERDHHKLVRLAKQVRQIRIEAAGRTNTTGRAGQSNGDEQSRAHEGLRRTVYGTAHPPFAQPRVSMM